MARYIRIELGTIDLEYEDNYTTVLYYPIADDVVSISDDDQYRYAEMAVTHNEIHWHDYETYCEARGLNPEDDFNWDEYESDCFDAGSISIEETNDTRDGILMEVNW